MRIIQGKYKGRYLEGFTIDGTRPTMDRVKESLFAMLQNRMRDSICLDLFAGSGNLGIEALSMGAKKVTFVDVNKKAVQTIQKNLHGIGETGEVLQLDFEKACLLFGKEKRTFTLIFLDPPYNSNSLSKALFLIQKENLLTQDGMVVCESDALDKIQYEKTYYQVEKEKKYGEKHIVILKRK